MLSEVFRSSAGKSACTITRICENWRLVLMISANRSMRDLVGGSGIRLIKMQCFDIDFFFPVFFLLVFLQL